MNKKILSIFLLAFLLAGFAVPIYADSDEVNIDIPETDPQVQAVNEAIDRIQLSAEDVNEEAVIEALKAEGINARADKFAYVFDFAGLEAALADEDVNIILLLTDIQMERELTIDRDISMSGVTGAVVTSAEAAYTRHFEVSAEDMVSLTFSNVVLDGGNISGGFYIQSSTHVNGAVIQNCSNVYGGAVTTSAPSTADVFFEFLEEALLSDEVQIPPYDMLTVNSGFDIILENCVITDNSATAGGGGIYITSDTAAIVNCDVSRNSSAGSAGGLYVRAQTSIDNSTISYNTSFGNAGGIMTWLSISSRNSEITHNTAGDWGGGLYIGSTADNNILGNTLISGNRSRSSGGGGICSSTLYPGLSISGGIIENNTAPYGGALYLNSMTGSSGGVIVRQGTFELSDMLIKDNYATRNGGGINIGSSDYDKVTLNEDVIFSGNTASKGYYMTDPEDIAIHDAHVFTTHFSEPFTQYAYNNFDIAYTKGEEVPVVTASFYLRYSDTEPHETASVYAGQPLGDKLPDGPEQSGLKFIGWVDINGVSYGVDTVITEDVSLYPAYILD